MANQKKNQTAESTKLTAVLPQKHNQWYPNEKIMSKFTKNIHIGISHEKVNHTFNYYIISSNALLLCSVNFFILNIKTFSTTLQSSTSSSLLRYVNLDAASSFKVQAIRSSLTRHSSKLFSKIRSGHGIASHTTLIGVFEIDDGTVADM